MNMARDRYKIFGNEYPYFITLTVIEWISAFSIKPITEIILDSLNYLINKKRLLIYAYVIMENHLHLVAQSKNLRKEISNFKSYTAKEAINYLKEYHYDNILSKFHFYKLKHKTNRNYQFWQEGFHPVMITNYNILHQKIDYIHNNPVRRGYIIDPTHWMYSSAKDYSGERGKIKVFIEWA